MAQLHSIQFPVLSDPTADTIRLYGVYNLLGDGVATPSVFIIDRQGIIRWWYVGKNIADRPPTEMLLQQLDRVS